MNISTMTDRFARLADRARGEAPREPARPGGDAGAAGAVVGLCRAQTPAHGASAGRGQQVLGALDSAGKRAAFALFYAPLHFIAVTEVLRARSTRPDAPKTIVDLGCGTGAAGAAWAIAHQSEPAVIGIDRHPWAVEEAQWTYQQLGVRGRARVGDVSRAPALRRGDAIVAAYVLNELPDAVRIRTRGPTR